MTNRLYLDANATEPLRPEARDAVIQALDVLGNPSSVHAAGRSARRLLEASRGKIATVLEAKPDNVVLTSGATEANALAVRGLGEGRRILVGATEHPSILQAANTVAVPVLSDGTVDLAALERLLMEGIPSLLCLMGANNETGVLHPVLEVAQLCRRFGALLHVDAVQMPGRVQVTLPGLQADSLALSAHKLGGPKGAGALILRPGLELLAMVKGGGQERGRRGGTEALPAIAGFAAALSCADPAEAGRLARLRDRLEAMSDAIIIGQGAARLPNTTCLLLPGVRAETQVIALDLAGVEVSAGSACSSGKVSVSHVLQAMGLEQDASCAIRVSLPWNASEDVPQRFTAAYAAMKQRILRRGAA